MKKVPILLALIVSVSIYASTANEWYITKKNAANSTNEQKVIVPVTGKALGFDSSGNPIAITVDGGTTGSSLLAGDGSGGFASVTIGSNLTFSGGTLSATGGGGGGTWGSITGTLSAQTDLNTALTSLVPKTTTVNGHALSGNVSVSLSDVGGAAASHTHTASQISDSSANGRAILTAADYAAMRTLLGLSTVATSGSYADLSGKPTLGTSAFLDVAASGNAASGQVVKGDDTRLTDARTPTDASVTTAKIATNAVTNAVAAQMVANTIKGNNTGSTANAADLTVSQVQTVLGVSTTSMASAIPKADGAGKIDGNFIPSDGWQIVLRKGTDAERTVVTPGSGEPLWTTDTKRLYVGDGSTAGGIAVGGTATTQALLFGDGSDGDVTDPTATTGRTSTSTTVLSRDMYYHNLTLTGAHNIDVNGYRVFVSGTLDLSSAPANAICSSKGVYYQSISGTSGEGPGSDGNAGGYGGSYITVFSAAFQTVGHIHYPGNGNDAGTGVGVATTIGDPINVTTGSGYPQEYLATQRLFGGYGSFTTSWKGGNGSSGTAANHGSQSPSGFNVLPRIVLMDQMLHGATLEGGKGGWGGGSGSGDSTHNGGGGGAGGFGGGVTFVSANVIQRSSTNSAGTISAPGSVGCIGGAGGTGNCGGGAGGCGGGGGVVYLIYATLTGTSATSFLSAPGGAGGNGGTHTGTGTDGFGGFGGWGGQVIVFNVTTQAVTVQQGTTPSAPTNATGASGGVCVVTL